MLEAAAWYLALQACALAAWPLAARALEPFEDRGWAAAKSLGIVALAWLAWATGMLTPVPFTRLTLAGGLLVLAGGAWGFQRRAGRASLLAWLRQSRLQILAWETVFLGAFAFFALLRAYDPAIAGTEKPMDMAFLNGFIVAPRLPTEDTWLSGYGVPYYYFGYLTYATLAKLSGTAPGTAYNLAAASVPALAMVGLSAAAWSLGRAARLRPGFALLGAVLAGAWTIFAGNLSAPLELLVTRGVLPLSVGQALHVKQFGEGLVPGVWPPPGAWWWRASRVIPNVQPDGIDEVPFFSAFLSDLHPHFMALPLEALVLALAVAHVASWGKTLVSPWTQGVAMVSLGALLVTNTWDVAAFWLLYVAAGWLAGGGTRARRRLALAMGGPVGALVLFAPYFVGYTGPPLGIGVVGERTPIGSFLVLFGPQLSLVAAFALWLRWRAGDRTGWLVTLVGVALGLALAAAGQATLGVLVALLGFVVPTPTAPEALSAGEVLAAGLGTLAVAILLGVELIYLSDTFGTRMNTVFKLHYNAWLLLGLAAGAGTAIVAAHGQRARWPMLLLAAVALGVGVVYPVSAVQTRLATRPPGGLTLDGLAFLPPDELGAIRWLRDQARQRGRPTIAEAVGGQYTSAARMATYSGAVSVLGWAGHEQQWRGSLVELARREADLQLLYSGGEPAAVREVLARYGVRFVVVGDLERQKYGSGVDARFDGLLPVAYRSGRVTVYRASG